MIEIGCNYSEPLVELIENDVTDVDWIKLSRAEILHEEMAVARPLRPVLAHIYPRAGLPKFSDIDWHQLNTDISSCGSPHVGLHFAASPEDWDTPVTDDVILDRMKNHVQLWAENINVPLLIENPPYYGFSGTLRCTTDPEAIRDVCEETGVGLLLDIAHARVASIYRNEDVLAYLQRMPLEYVRELHVNGPKLDSNKGFFVDCHLEMADEDYRLLEWVLTKSEPNIITLEYGGTGPKMEKQSDIHKLKEQLEKLNQIVGRHSASTSTRW